MSSAVKRCPFCAEEIAAEAIKCKHCRSMLIEGGPAGTMFDYPPTVLTVPMIVSAVWNLITAAGWAFFVPCFGLFVAIPYTLLAVCEIVTFQRASTMSPPELHGRCGWLGGFQIFLGLANVLPIICGVLLLAYRDRLLDYRPMTG